MGETATKSHITIGKEPDIFDAIFHSDESIDTHTEGIATILRRIDTCMAEYFGMKHPCTHQLYPSCLLTE